MRRAGHRGAGGRWQVALLALAALAATAAPARAGAISGLAGNLLLPGTPDADGNPLTPPIGSWFQVAAQTTPPCTTYRVHLASPYQFAEYWSHSPDTSTCTVSSMPNPNDTIDCDCKPEGRLCFYGRVLPDPTVGQSVSVTATFPGASTDTGSTDVGAAAAGCPLRSGGSSTTTSTSTSTSSTAAPSTLPPVGPDPSFSTAPHPAIPGVGNLGVTGAAPISIPPYGFLPGYLNTAFGAARGLGPNGAATTNVVDVAVGDFNGDGIADVVSASDDSGANRLVVLMGAGDGTFGFPQAIDLGTLTPTAVATTDIDLDGQSDVAVVGQECPGGACTVDVMVFAGTFLTAFPGGTPVVNGTTVQHLTLATTAMPASIAFGRLDGDPFSDLVVGLAGSPGAVAVGLTGPGGVYGPFVQFAAPDAIPFPAPRAVATGVSNLSPDGGVTPPDADTDIFVATNAGVAIFENAGGGTFSAPAAAVLPAGGLPGGTNPDGVATIDFDGDGRTDVLGLNRGSGSLSTFLGVPGGGYGTSLQSVVGANPLALTTLNFNGDVRPDVAVVDAGSGAPGTVSLLTGNANGSFSPSISLTSTFGSAIFAPHSVAKGKSDGISTTDDIVLADGVGASTAGGVLYLDGGVGYGPIPLKLFTAVSLAADFDGTGGLNDIALMEQNYGLVVVLLNVSASSTAPTVSLLSIFDLFTGSFESRPTSATTFKDALTGLQNLAITDVATPVDTSGSGRIIVGINDGTGLFNDVLSFRQFVATPGATNIMSGDFNNDGVDDLAYVDFQANFAAVTLNDGTNFFLTPQFRETGGFVPVSAVAADVNDDDKLDLVVVNQGDPGMVGGNQSIVSVLLGQGDGRLVPTGQLLQVPNFALSIVGGLADVEGNGSRRVVDFNNDGFPDFAVASTRGAVNSLGQPVPTVTLLLNRPDSPGTFTVSAPIALIDDTTPGAPRTLALADTAGGPGLVSGRRGQGGPPGPIGIGFGGANYTMAVADFNADGAPDLVVSGAELLDLDGTAPSPIDYRASIYLVGDRGAGTVRVSRPLRTTAYQGEPGNLLRDPGDAGDTFVAAATGAFAPGPNALPDVAHVSLNGSLWVDANQTSILNHAPILDIRRADLNAPFPGGGRKMILTAGESATVPVTGTDVEGEHLQFHFVGSVPSFVTLTDNGDNSATVHVTSADANPGPGDTSFRIAVEATDTGGTGPGGRLPLTGRAFFTLVVKPNTSCAPNLVTPGAAAAPSCDDGNACTSDTCIPGIGCVSTPFAGIASASCVCEATFDSACNGEALPKPMTRAFGKACKLLHKGLAATDPKKQKKFAKKALPSLRKSLKTAAPKKPRTQPACTQALRTFFTDAVARDQAVVGGGATTTTTTSTSTTTVSTSSTSSTVTPTTSTTTTLYPNCPSAAGIAVHTVVNPPPGGTSVAYWRVGILGFSCTKTGTVTMLDLATRQALPATIFTATTHTEAYIQDPISGLPVVQMTLTNHASSGTGGERKAVYGLLNWPP